WGASARDAVRLLDRRLLSATHTGRSGEPETDEYVAVLRRRRDIVQAAVAAVDPPEADTEILASAVAHLVDALAAAIRVGDPQLLLDFTDWQGAALSSRTDRTDVLDTLLAACAATLVEHPRSDRYLRLARASRGSTGADAAGLRPS
ncbi:hypothetical protein AB0I76_12465, partial [Micromonospora sp. NPDC049799]